MRRQQDQSASAQREYRKQNDSDNTTLERWFRLVERILELIDKPGAHILILLAVFGCGFNGMRAAVPGADNLTVLSLVSLLWFMRRRHDRPGPGASLLRDLLATILYPKAR